MGREMVEGERESETHPNRKQILQWDTSIHIQIYIGLRSNIENIANISLVHNIKLCVVKSTTDAFTFTPRQVAIE